MPRVPRSQTSRLDSDKVFAGLGCLVALAAVAFYGLVAFVVTHFVLKYW
jgi:hypothetical protein